MSEAKPFQLSDGMIRIHRIITRGLEVILDQSPDYSLSGFPDAAIRDGFLNYTHCLLTTLAGHHESEDAITFPAFRAVLPAAPYADLDAEHRAMDPLLREGRTVLDRLKAGGPAEALLIDLHRITGDLARIWYPHIETEERFFDAEKVGRVMPLPEQGQLAPRLAEHAQRVSVPDYLVIPFLLYNLPAAERAEFASIMPPVLVEQMIPVVWKNHWASMRPFLLE
jgi:hypothetical protein